MPRAPRAPKGYREFDWPLFHTIPFRFGLQTYSATTKLSTILPLFFHDNEVIATPSTTAVNPKNAAHAESAEMGILSNSIVPKLKLNFTVRMTEAAIETDKLREIHFMWYPIYIAFVENLIAFDEKTGDTIEEILNLTHSTTDEVTTPVWGANDLFNASLLPASVTGLTTDQKIENVNWSEANRNRLFQGLKYYGNAGKLRTSVGRMHHFNVTRDRSYRYSTDNFTVGKVKSGNPYTFCAINIITDETDKDTSSLIGTETTNIEHLRIHGRISFQEWNHMFNQDTE